MVQGRQIAETRLVEIIVGGELMGDLNPTQRVTDVVKRIEERKYQLPSIQRPFVWEKDQILRLLDSVMCSYPIGAVMVWQPIWTIRCRPFLRIFRSGDRLLSDLPPAAEEKAYMVLDGQQRLQSLYLSFKGLYDGKRVYLGIDSLASQEDDDLHYKFDFLTDGEAKSNPAYVQLSELAKLNLEDIDEFVEEQMPNLSTEAKRRAIKIAGLFVRRFMVNEVMLFQEVDENLGYNDVLNVFERVNSGGTPLSKSDLLFSTVTLKIPDMEERFIRIVDELNDNGRHDFNTDFVVKTSFVVFGKKAKYDYEKLRDDEFLTKLQADFEILEKVITSLRVWLHDKALIKSRRFLPSKLAIIPIIDYLLMNKKWLGPSEGDETKIIRQFLYMTFFMRLFSRAPDSILDQIHDILEKARISTSGIFPIREIGEFISRREKKGGYQFRDEYLWDLDLVLNIIEGGVMEIPIKRGWSLERDHIFPKHQLEIRGINQDVNHIGNFRLLSKSRNISKGADMPDENTEFFGKENPELQILYDNACKELNQENFSQFVTKRKDLIMHKVTVFLGMENKV